MGTITLTFTQPTLSQKEEAAAVAAAASSNKPVHCGAETYGYTVYPDGKKVRDCTCGSGTPWNHCTDPLNNGCCG